LQNRLESKYILVLRYISSFCRSMLADQPTVVSRTSHFVYAYTNLFVLSNTLQIVSYVRYLRDINVISHLPK